MQKILSILFFTVITLFADANISNQFYNEIEGIEEFNKHFNQIIEEHNSLNNDEFEMEEEKINNIKDFEEIENGYILNFPIDEETKVLLSVKDKILSIATSKQIHIKDIETNSTETIITHSVTSLFLPYDADENSLTEEYNNEILKIQFLKKQLKGFQL